MSYQTLLQAQPHQHGAQIGDRYEQIRKIVQSSRFLVQNDCHGPGHFDRFLCIASAVKDIPRASLFAQVLYPGIMGLPSGCLRATDSH